MIIRTWKDVQHHESLGKCESKIQLDTNWDISWHSPTRVAVRKMVDNNQGLWVWKDGNSLVLLVKCKMVQSLWNTVWQFHTKLNINITQPSKSGIPADEHVVWPPGIGRKTLCCPQFGLDKCSGSQIGADTGRQLCSLLLTPESAATWEQMSLTVECSLSGEREGQVQALHL